ncbi:MAG: phosphatidylglycerophosphatase A [Planctomycetota bacterium]
MSETAKKTYPLDPVRWFLITSGGLGMSPFAPGTVGTFGGVGLAVLLQWAMPGRYILAWGIAAAVLFVWGSLQSDYVARTWPKKDPGAYVLDEVVGHLVTLIVFALLAQRVATAGGGDGGDGAGGILASSWAVSPLAHAGAFFWFRVFDVLKLQPCKWLEGLPGAWGIMADDQVAGVYAGVALWLTLPIVAG